MTEKTEREKLLNKLVWAVRKVLWEGDAWDDDTRTIVDAAIWFSRDGWTLWFSESEARVYQEAIRAIIDFGPLVRSYSTRTLIGKWQSLLVLLVEEFEEQPLIEVLNERITSWLQTLLEAQEQNFTYYAVIDNLMTEETRQVGRVTFSPATAASKEGIERGIHLVLDQNPNYANKDNALKRIKEDISESLKDFSSPSATTIVWTELMTRDIDRGKELALEAIEESLLLVRYLGTQSSGETNRPVGVQGTVGNGLRTIPAVSAKSYKVYRERVVLPLRLQRIVQTGTGYVEFERILRKTPEKRDELESKLAGALSWLGHSAEEVSEPARLLKVWIAIEMLLTADNERSPGQVISERAAFLLETSPGRRREVVRIVKRIFHIRNDLVHRGKARNDDDVIRYLPYAFGIAAHGLTKVAKLREENAWTEFAQLKEHLENLKYA